MYLDAKDLDICPDCGTIKNREYTNPQLRISQRKYDFSYTYDGRAVASRRFREFCDMKSIEGGVFHELIMTEGFFHFQVRATRVVEVCRDKPVFNIGERCRTCGHSEYFCGVKPMFLRTERPLGTGFYRTDVYYADKNERQPCYIVSVDTKRMLELEEFRGIGFHPVYSEDTEYLGGGKVGA